LSQENFAKPTHRAIIQAAVRVLKLRAIDGGDPSATGVPVETLCQQIKLMIKAKDIMREEVEEVCNEIDNMYDMELDVATYGGAISDFISETSISNIINGLATRKLSKQEANRKIRQMALDEGASKKKGIKRSTPLLDVDISEDPVDMVPCGIHTIDGPMNGGLGTKEYGIICGITGLGKTTLGINMTWGAARLGHHSAIATLELPEAKILDRLYSNICNIPYSRMRIGDNGSKSNVKQEVESFISEYDMDARGRFHIIDASEDECTVRDLELQIIEMTKEFPLRLLFVDWLDAIATDPKDRIDGMVKIEYRHKLSEFSTQLAKMAVRHNIAIWATTQSNVQGEEKSEVRMSNASESFSKAHRCSVFLGLGATTEQRNNNVNTITASKMRDGRIFTAQIEADMDYQRFADLPPDFPIVPTTTGNDEVQLGRARRSSVRRIQV